MKFSDLDTYLQDVMSKFIKQPKSSLNQPILPIEIVEYNQIFWQLHNDKSLSRDELGRPALAKNATELVHQLNQYIIANREKLTKQYPLKNPVLIKRPKPPLRQQFSRYLPEIDRLDQQLMRAPDFGYPAISTNSGSVINAEFYLGQLLYTAARFGGVLQATLLESLLQRLSGSCPSQYKGVVWFNLNGDVEYPWLPDPISSALLPRYYKLRDAYNWALEPRVQQLKWLRCIRHFLRNSGCPQLAQCGATQLLCALNARLSITHTPCHLGVATGKEPNVPLTMEAFTRLLGRYHSTSTAEEFDDEPQEPIISQSEQAMLTSASSSLQPLTQAITDCVAVIKLVKRELSSIDPNASQEPSAISDKSLAALSKRLLAISGSSEYTLLPVTKLLIEWAAIRLTSQNKWSSKLKPNSLITYLNQIVKPMTRAFAGHEVITLAQDNIASIDEYYMEIIDEAPGLRSQTMRAKILRDFHLFLEKQYLVAPSYICSTFVMHGAKRVQSMVDANILLPHEYQQACEVLVKRCKQSLTPQRDYIPLILLLLGFRCGLRRREALLLRRSDIQTPGGKGAKVSSLTELLVRPHSARQLKSAAAERRLPLGQLFTEQERGWLNEYLALCQHDETNIFVFYDQTTNTVIDADAVFIPLVHQLKHITRDPGFRYHRLRHSFVTWTFWYWQQHKYPNEHPLKELLHHDVMQHLPAAREHYFHQANNTAVRGELHAISAMAGHASPSMTLLHYLHSVHWCQSAENWRDYSLHQDAIVGLLAIPRRTFFHQKDKHGLLSLLSRAITPWCSILNDAPQASTETISGLTQPVQKINIQAIYDLYQALYKFYGETRLFEAYSTDDDPFTIEDDEINIYCLDKQHPSRKALLNIENAQQDWAIEHFVNPEQFFQTIGLLKTRLEKDNRAERQQRNRFSGRTYTSQKSRYELPRWLAKGYASKTAFALLKAFKALTEAEQATVLQVAAYIVNDRVISWNNCQFRNPEKLWRFVSQMEPLMKWLPSKYYINIDILSRYLLDSQERTDLTLTWQKPDNISINPDVNHTVYPDAKGNGYAALTLRATSPKHGVNRQGDHGFYLGMSAIYFYFNSLPKLQADATHVQVATAPKPPVQEAPAPLFDDENPVTPRMLEHNTVNSSDDDESIPSSFHHHSAKECDFGEAEYIFGNEVDLEMMPNYERPKRKSRRASKVSKVPPDLDED